MRPRSVETQLFSDITRFYLSTRSSIVFSPPDVRRVRVSAQRSPQAPLEKKRDKWESACEARDHDDMSFPMLVLGRGIRFLREKERCTYSSPGGFASSAFRGLYKDPHLVHRKAQAHPQLLAFSPRTRSRLISSSPHPQKSTMKAWASYLDDHELYSPSNTSSILPHDAPSSPAQSTMFSNAWTTVVGCMKLVFIH